MLTKRCGSCDEHLPLEDFCKLKSSKDGRYWRCRKCESLSQKKNRDNRKYHLWHRFGITPKEYDAMLEAQSGGCAICGGKSSKGRLAVDHDHETGEIRGLLCANCNRGIGLLRDDSNLLRLAASYLDRKAN